MAPAIKVLNKKDNDLPNITGLHKDIINSNHKDPEETYKELEVEK